jgi:type III pantothenate kinase
MLLAVDVGNTQTVLGLFDGDRLRRSWRVRTDARATADEMMLTLRGLLSDQPRLTGVAVCSSVPAVLGELRQVFERWHQHVRVVVVEPGTRTGVPLLYDNPKEVGPDRIVNSLAAYTLFGGPCVVVDFGTSTNFDVVGPGGEFLGGALAPGIEISIDALASRAARLVKVEIARPRTVIGKSTVEALQSGFLYGFTGQVDGIVRRIVAELGGSVTAVVATGGLADAVVAESETITEHRPDLTLLGLRLVYERNT